MSDETDRPTLVLEGIAASSGIAAGPAVVLERGDGVVPRRAIAIEECDEECERYRRAVQVAQEGWRRTLERLAEDRPERAILEAYVLMAGDTLLAAAVERHVRLHLRSAEWAVSLASREIAERLDALDDPYLSERSHDVDFVGRRLVRALSAGWGANGEEERESLRVVTPSIVVAHELSPADTAAMSGLPILGFVTEVGSRTSHGAIMARALGLPAVTGIAGLLDAVAPGDPLVVNGSTGSVTVRADSAAIADARASMTTDASRGGSGARRDVPTSTSDGTSIALLANVERLEDATSAIEHGAEGVGLYRTEYLFVARRTPPTEDEQYAAFVAVASCMSGRRVTLRTFDLGGDKLAGSLSLPREQNPMLGLRAVRLQLGLPEVTSAHLAAMVRASADADVRVLVPLVSSVEELDRMRDILERAKASVDARGLRRAKDIPLGAMIEVPAAAMIAEHFVAAADFVSLGTNDLVQHTLAMDRGNPALASAATPFHPAVLRLIRRVVDAAQSGEASVSVCGEMASEPLGALLCVGLGVRELSMEPAQLERVRSCLAAFEVGELREVALCALAARGATEVLGLLREAFASRLRDVVGLDVVLPIR